MADHINRCTFHGVLAQSAQHAGVGTPVTFTIRCEHEFRVGRNYRRQQVMVPCEWWGPKAEAESHKLTKGLCVFAEGRFETKENGIAFIRVASVSLVGARKGAVEHGAEADDTSF